jgi:hypothetical protein
MEPRRRYRGPVHEHFSRTLEVGVRLDDRAGAARVTELYIFVSNEQSQLFPGTEYWQRRTR